jgi:hypothetical protein
MNIIERGRVFVQRLQELAQRSGWDWRRCPQCHGCGAFYDEEYAFVVRGSWYAREVHRYAVDGWVHLRSSLRRIAETVRSWIGHQERWWLWHPWEKRPEGQGECRFHHSTVQRWVGCAEKKA